MVNDMNNSRWVALVEQYLERHELSWAEFSVQMRVGQNTLSRAKLGKGRLKRPVERRIARRLGMATVFLFGSEEP